MMAAESPEQAFDDDDDADDDDTELATQEVHLVHIHNVPATSSLSDVNVLFVNAGFELPFSFRVSDSVVAVQLESAAAVAAAVALTGTTLTPPKVGHVKIPGQVISVVPVP